MADLSATLLVKRIAHLLREHNLRCAVAESCTGGLIAARLTDYPGSSEWFDCGLVTYSNTAKQQFLGLSPQILTQFGAVSQETVIAMAEGVLQRTHVHYSLAVSGIAGPGGGSLEKPVGTVWFAWASQNQPTQSQMYHLQGTRNKIRKTCVTIALSGLLDIIS